MRLQDLADGWNVLRNAALGRGVEPRVSAELAERVATDYERFRLWLADQGPLSEIVPEISARPWLDLQRELAARVRAEGEWAPDVAPSALERGGAAAAEGATAVARGTFYLVIGAGVLGVTYLLAKGGR